MSMYGKKSLWHRVLEGFTATAFAEAGEFDTAQKIAREASFRPSLELSWWEKAMAAIAFAEAGEFDTAQKFSQKDLVSEIEVKSRRLDNLLETSLESAAAAAFAEAGDRYQAIKIIARLRGKKVLIVCEGAHIPERLMQQGIELAEKMGLELVVLNIFTHTMTATASKEREKWRAQLKKKAAKSLTPWRKKHPKLRFQHQVVFGVPGEVIKQILPQIKGVRYILSLKEIHLEESIALESQMVHSWRH